MTLKKKFLYTVFVGLNDVTYYNIFWSPMTHLFCKNLLNSSQNHFDIYGCNQQTNDQNMICLVKIFYFVVNIFNIVFLFNQLQGLNQLLDSNSITLIDVRNRTELNTVGQIPGSFCLPLHEVGDAMELSSEEFFAKYKFVKPSPDDRKIVLTCRSGRRVLVRSVTSFQIDHGNFLSYFVIQIIRNTFCHCCVFRSKIKSSKLYPNLLWKTEKIFLFLRGFLFFT